MSSLEWLTVGWLGSGLGPRFSSWLAHRGPGLDPAIRIAPTVGHPTENRIYEINDGYADGFLQPYGTPKLIATPNANLGPPTRW